MQQTTSAVIHVSIFTVCTNLMQPSSRLAEHLGLVYPTVVALGFMQFLHFSFFLFFIVQVLKLCLNVLTWSVSGGLVTGRPRGERETWGSPPAFPSRVVPLVVTQLFPVE